MQCSKTCSHNMKTKTLCYMVLCKYRTELKTRNRTNEEELHYGQCSVNRIGEQAAMERFSYLKKKKGPLTCHLLAFKLLRREDLKFDSACGVGFVTSEWSNVTICDVTNGYKSNGIVGSL